MSIKEWSMQRTGDTRSGVAIKNIEMRSMDKPILENLQLNSYQACFIHIAYKLFLMIPPFFGKAYSLTSESDDDSHVIYPSGKVDRNEGL